MTTHRCIVNAVHTNRATGHRRIADDDLRCSTPDTVLNNPTMKASPG
ncbi:hypothetical protein [Pseudonocardia sp. ICBG162]|nr:hypothetical protein [Pseudonocardia sp. ICBG162]